MSRPLLTAMILLAACANKEAPSTAAPDATDASRTEAPVSADNGYWSPSDGDGDGDADAGEAGSADAGDAACAPSEVVLVKETRAPLNGGMPPMEIMVHDNGHWSLTGPTAKTGCLDEATLGEVQAAVAAAEIVAKPLEPGMARCMAMPIHTVTVEAKGESASWKAPCGSSNPTETLAVLQKKLVEVTSGQ